MSKFDIKAALKEVQEKDEEDIEIETSYKWASRAIACFQLYTETELVTWLLKGEDYRHEALEHAALAKDHGKTLNIIDKEIEKHRATISDSEKAEPKKIDAFSLRYFKLAQLMRSPEDVSMAIITMINTLATYASGNFDFKKSVKNNITKINAGELAAQQMSGGALVGQVINFIKAALRGQEQKFILDTLKNVMVKL